jgi:hypothetical protein
MRLFSEKVAVLLIASSIACDDATGPGASAQFALENINGRPLPTYFSATPGLTATVLWATLTLGKDGKAVMSEHRREEYGSTESEETYTNTFDYRIHGGLIEIGSFQPCASNAICIPNRTGTYFGDRVSLIMVASVGGSITYNYRIPLTL